MMRFCTTRIKSKNKIWLLKGIKGIVDSTSMKLAHSQEN